MASDSQESQRPILKILLIRNDNIGDLICSIPAIELIRRCFPQAKLDLLVNSYNAPIVEPLVPKHIDRLIVYRKTKHVGLGPTQLLHLAQFYLGLRREKYDAAVVLVGGDSPQSQSFAKWSGAAPIIGYGPGNDGPCFHEGKHEVEYSWDLAAYFCGSRERPPAQIDYPVRATGMRHAIQLTSRKQGNRWDSTMFAAVASKIFDQTGEKSILLWSPGSASTLTHPGDDEKAAEVIALAPMALEARPTQSLQQLVAALKECCTLVTPDGGAMHLASAMGIRLVAMFGQSEPSRWKPWSPFSIVLQSKSRTIQDISVEEVFAAWKQIFKGATSPG